ncbi:hypothetical protein ACFO0N_06700 [Halobium salinum]|uniref:Uncharacterized protein n=1 Tax=Halobium salinum TaxID=1364940 RepID=A0ABD5PAE9_9EURY|nr:hypothetical protein [Halobium salinum]
MSDERGGGPRDGRRERGGPVAGPTPEQVAHELTGRVLGGFAVSPDLDAGAVACGACGSSAPDLLRAGDDVVVAYSHYEGRTWEPVAVRCAAHAVSRLTDLDDVRAEDQALIRAVLEPTGYRDPLGGEHPDALTLGGVAVLDCSPAAEGYPD